MNKQYYVYIMTNERHSVLYTGVTNDLKRRVYEHKEKLTEGFTKKYKATKRMLKKSKNRIGCHAELVSASETLKQVQGDKTRFFSNLSKLVYYDVFDNIENAIYRGSRLKEVQGRGNLS